MTRKMDVSQPGRRIRRMAPVAASICLLAGFLASCGEDDGTGGGNEAFPHDSLTLVVPRDPGGGQDLHARRISKYLGEELGGIDVTVENHPGAGSQTGIRDFLRRGADCSVLLAEGMSAVASVEIVQGADIKASDLAIVNVNESDPAAIAVRSDSPYKTIDDLVAAMKKDPGEVNLGSNATGQLRAGSIAFQQSVDAKANDVFFDGGSDLLNAVLGGHVDAIVHASTTLETIADDIRVLAVLVTDDADPAFETWDGAASLTYISEKLGDGTVPPVVPGDRSLFAHPDCAKDLPEQFDTIVSSMKAVIEGSSYQKFLEDDPVLGITAWYGPEESARMMQETLDSVAVYKDELG